MQDATLTAARMLSPTVRELTFATSPSFRFVPGQWISLRLPQPGGEELSRAYSISSPPRDDGSFDIAVTLVEHGPGSRALHAAEPGTRFLMSEAQGYFTLNPVERPVLMVGTGTGVAPFRSMLIHASRNVPESRARFVLLFGVRSEDDMLYVSDFQDLAKKWGDFRFEPSLSRPSNGWSGRRGYVQLHLADLVSDLGGDCDVYVCGLNRMIRDVRHVLKEQLGFTRQRIHTERYD
jgi:CDP-4-dehydro-6-deoxyglucose reductase